MLRFVRVKISLTLAIILVFIARTAFAQMTSSNYQILWDEFSSGGGQGVSSSYIEQGSAGNSGSQAISSTNYSISDGFRGGVYDPSVAFIPYIQDTSTQVAATSFASASSPSSYAVTVTTTTGYSVGDVVLVFQNEGQSQTVFMGRISNVTPAPPIISFYSDYAGSIPTIDGVNDYVYRMSTTASIGLGTLTTTAVSQHTIGWMATADVTNGYSTYLFSDGDLRSGSNTIAAVTDGSVTSGSSEYGARSSDTTLDTSTFDTVDTAITTSPALIGSVGSSTFSSLGFVTLKAAISSSQPQGSYSQVLTTIFVGNY